MKKKSLLAAAVLAALMVPQVAGAEGFGLIEYSAEGVAMGGARMFAENDPANIAYNPASITKVPGKAFKTGVSYISPHGSSEVDPKPVVDGRPTMGAVQQMKVTGDPTPVMGTIPALMTPVSLGRISGNKNVVHPGYVPHMYYTQQMTDKDWWGVGAFSRYAMVSEFSRGSYAGSNAFLSKMTGISLTPTYAHKFDKKWSAAIGAEVNYVGLTLRKDLYLPTASTIDSVGANLSEPMKSAMKPALDDLKNAVGDSVAYVGDTKLKGDSIALGWNAAVNYAFDDKNEMGVVYRSKIKHSLEADFELNGNKVADAYGIVYLPDQWNIGYNHKFDSKQRVEVNAMRTNWNTYDALNIGFTPYLLGSIPSSDNVKNYKYGWRYAIGYEYKFSPKYTGMLGFSFDGHSIPQEGGDFIVPTGLRRTYSCGVRYNDKKQAVSLGLAWMQLGDLSFNGHATDAYYRAHSYNNTTKIMSVSYERHF